MALPVIIFNSSTGSDSAASGAGPATALTGSGAALDGDTTISLAADSPDLSGVATDGSAVLWVNSSSGRQFFKITAVDNGTKVVTVANAATPTESGKTWAIGGKRATVNETNSRKLFSADILPGWIVETDADQAITATAITCGVSGDTTSGPITVRGASSATHPTITQGANAAIFSFNNINYWRFENLKFANSNATKTLAAALSLRSLGMTAENCIFGDATNKLLTAALRSGGSVEINFVDCEIAYCTDDGVQVNNNSFAVHSHGCWVHDNTAKGLELGTNSYVAHSVIEDNGDDGMTAVSSATGISIEGNVVDGNAGDGLDTSVGVLPFIDVVNNQFTNNANYGWRAASGQLNFGFADFNNYYQNTSGTILNATAGAHDQALDPQYVDAGNNNFELGTNLKAKGFPDATRFVGANQSATNAFVDIGIQREEAGGGGAPRFGPSTSLLRGQST